MAQETNKTKDVAETPAYNEEHYRVVCEGAEAIKAYRKQHLCEELNLQGAVLQGLDLRNADLRNANLQNAHLANADLRGAKMQGANLSDAQLNSAKLSKADLRWAKLTNAYLFHANLDESELRDAVLKGAHLNVANLTGALLSGTNLQEADLSWANLTACEFIRTSLVDTCAEVAIVDSRTVFRSCTFAQTKGQTKRLLKRSRSLLDRHALKKARQSDGTFIQIVPNCTGTNFIGVGLETARFYPPEGRMLLEYNIRRLSWQRWYDTHPIRALFAGGFWTLSDYGRSTGRLLFWFIFLAIVFAAIYLIPTTAPFPWMEATCPWSDDGRWPALVTALDDPVVDGTQQQLGIMQTWVRALYFSVVTMTTLGFGDIHAHPLSIAGHLLLTLQVLFGYFLLGALITRLAVMFQAVGRG